MALAQENLADRYSNGEGIPQDYEQAAKWYPTAAEQSHGSAQYKLALAYAMGRGVRRDLHYAYKWATVASLNGIKEATQTIDLLETKMSADDIGKALKLGSLCLDTKYKKC